MRADIPYPPTIRAFLPFAVNWRTRADIPYPPTIRVFLPFAVTPGEPPMPADTILHIRQDDPRDGVYPIRLTLK